MSECVFIEGFNAYAISTKINNQELTRGTEYHVTPQTIEISGKSSLIASKFI